MERKVFVDTSEILDEVKEAPVEGIDYYTFSGKGEPTLAKNLGEMIKGVKQLRDCKVAVITNSCLINDVDVQKDLYLADCIFHGVLPY